MSIPVDLPGGEKIHEWPAPHLQPGVEQLPDGGFRGVVLVGAAEGGEPSTYVCDAIHALRDAAFGDALAYVAQHKSAAMKRDDVSAHL